MYPFTANSLAIFVGAVTAELPNITASDIVIDQVTPRAPPFTRALPRSSHILTVCQRADLPPAWQSLPSLACLLPRTLSVHVAR